MYLANKTVAKEPINQKRIKGIKSARLLKRVLMAGHLAPVEVRTIGGGQHPAPSQDSRGAR